MKFLVALILLLSSVSQCEKLKVSAYIESLCPDTTRFIQSSLLKALQTPQFEELVELRLVPYGKASQVLQNDSKIVFQCQHGDLECFGNKIQACGFDALNASQQEQINFLTCIQKSRKRQQEDFENEIRQCLPDLWEGVLECAKGTEGVKLLWTNGEETLNLDPKLTYVPWVTVDGKFDSKAHEQIERNIVKWACQIANKQKDNYTQIEACEEYQ
ncbi:unnamed protein product (macronuclear) [Paramecium tetraurelia]|uniref:Uncharacterized protein n=1 Tax=Paramecium tetraurelia TaxID=5888 RepID=A0C9T2_PARTE|nr:uncharacterized protein GSPATT00006856001 [Paramecium tetraurelia]CAK67549.1 unnamed protein product [Paramecium tetraurelia]|eukprot:XP_001434946.1 hypothetical protein (macronuclear) [Paramecium tetraurelia strain d4-2]